MNLVVESGCCFLIFALLFSNLTASYPAEATFGKDEYEQKNSTSDNRESAYSNTISNEETAVGGSRYELVCKFEGTSSSPIVWSRNEKRFQPNDRVKESKYGQSLIIEPVTLDDFGSYTCEKSNDKKPTESYTIYLEIEYAPYHLSEPYDEYVNLGETVELKCFAVSLPRPAFKWTRHGRPIGSNLRISVNNEILIIKDVKEEDIGAYGCNASNPHGSVYREVSVNVPPIAAKIVQPPTDVVAVDGKIATMTCQVFGAPMPEVQWMRNGEELIGGRFKKLNTGDLQIHDVRLSDAGEYRCEAINRFGKAAASAHLAVKNHTKIMKGPQDEVVAVGSSANLNEARAQATLLLQEVPNPPTILGVTCGQNEAQVSWAPSKDNRPPALRYSIQYNTSFTPDTWETAIDYILGSHESYIIKSLSPWTNYTFRVIAWNEHGPSKPSLPSSVCTTPADVPYKNPENVEAKGDDPTSLVIKWTVMPQIDHHAPKFMYRVYYKRDIPGEKWIKEDIHDWRINYLKIFNQPTYQRYKIMVGAINERGETWEPPQEITGYSGEDVPIQAPGTFTLERIVSNTTAKLSWTKVPDATVRGELHGYKIVTWNDKDGEEATQEFEVKGTGKTFALVNTFVPNTKNYAIIRIFNGSYDGVVSEVISFEMPSEVSEASE